jgi:tetraacyldisaccharide 4'-kinase
MIKLLKPKFWDNKNKIFSIILLPISALIQLLLKFKKNISVAKKFNIPIICVGNIYIGGTGKTPLSINIANELKNSFTNVVIIKKFYKNQKDEHILINEKSGSLITNFTRIKALEEAEKKGSKVAILDDGFQDYTIKKDLNILCFNNKQLIGNGFTFPSGPLRESFNSIKGAQIIVINGEENKVFEKKIYEISKGIKIYYSKYIPLNIDEFKNKKLFAIAGIGNPNNFFELLNENDLKVEKSISFPDHYAFNKNELEKIIHYSKKNNLEIVTTEKDYHRVKNFELSDIRYLKIELQILKKNDFFKNISNYL